ncbi:hypothetical protein DFP72DRAFT_839388 [Ephemerocybe angulata]|uniref:Uncharacterized protein n=1 Tax=Ephemerocybe angulata TaxID=980116 RepID=A0A8H6MH03_9AGAR|nr:hypothetical protein DFP72DRAFT_839388 [Tulosesus angulatus]
MPPLRRAIARKKAQNRRHYLLLKPPPTLSPALVHHLKMPISWMKTWSIYERFSQGQEMLVLDEVELDKSSLDILVGLPPYPAALTSLEHFEDVWESIAGALHGRMVYRYKLEMEGQAERMRGASEGDVREELWRMYASLLKQYKQLSAALGATPMYKYSPTETIIYANVLWAARLISYAVEDIRALICGYSYLLRVRTDRFWNLGRCFD